MSHVLVFVTKSSRCLTDSRSKHMDKDPLFIIATIACVVVLAILVLGIGSFAKGGEFSHKHSNRLMRYRIGAQFVAVILILIAVYFGKA